MTLDPKHARAAAAALALVVAGGLAAPPASAHGYRLGAIFVGHFWSDASRRGARQAGVYGILLNGGKEADQLVGASSPVARRVRIRARAGGHQRWPAAIELAPARAAALAPWRAHLWLEGLKRPLTAGMRFPLTLSFRRAGSITIEVVVGRDGRH